MDTHGATYGLRRPMPGADPAHIQPRDGSRNIVLALRTSRVKDRPARVAAQQKAAGHRTRYAKAAAHHHGQRRS